MAIKRVGKNKIKKGKKKYCQIKKGIYICTPKHTSRVEKRSKIYRVIKK